MRLRPALRPGLLALLLPALGAAQPAEMRATAEVVAEPVEVGAVFELEVRVDHPPGAEAAPVLEDGLGPFRVLGALPVSGEGPGEGADPASRFRVRLGAFVLPGDHEVPPVPVGIRNPDGGLALIETPPTPVRVVSSLPADAEAGDIHDIRGPFDLRRPPQWGWIALVALALAGAVAAVWWWLRRRGGRLTPAPPPPPPAVEAEAALARLRAAGLLEAGEVPLFYERLAAIMKRYAGRRFGTRWSERTTREILADLEARAENGHSGSLPLLAAILGEADLAKFSHRPLGPPSAEARLEDAARFLDRTRPAPTAAADPGAVEAND